jgi:hypothetical protein
MQRDLSEEAAVELPISVIRVIRVPGARRGSIPGYTHTFCSEWGVRADTRTDRQTDRQTDLPLPPGTTPTPRRLEGVRAKGVPRFFFFFSSASSTEIYTLIHFTHSWNHLLIRLPNLLFNLLTCQI